MIDIVLVGFGKWGANYLKTVEKCADARICQIIRKDLSKTSSNLLGVTFDKLEDVNTDQIEAAIIASPPDLHFEHAKFFLERSIPILLEKPICNNYDDTKALFKLAKDHYTPILVNNIHLFSDAFLICREIVDNWEKPLFIHTKGGNAGPYRDYSSLLDYGPHDLSMILSLFEDKLELKGVKKQKTKTGEKFKLSLSIDQSIVIMEVGNGFSSKYRQLTIRNQDHSITYDDLCENKLVMDKVPISVKKSMPLDNLIQAFLIMLKTGQTDWRFSYQLNLEIMEVLDKGMKYGN